RPRLRRLADQPLEGAWLRLTDESRRELERGRPVLARTGEMLGALDDERGRRRHMLRFADAKLVVDPAVAMAAAGLQATLAMQAQLEAIEERLVEVRKTLKQLVEDLDSERLADISASTEILEDVARQIRRRGRMEPTDWDRVVEVEHELRSALKQAQWS